MVRSIGPIGKKAGSCARVHGIPPAGQGRGRRAPGRLSPWEQPWQEPLQQLWLPLGRQRFYPRSELLSQPPWICWFRLSLPGLLAVRADPGCAGSQGWMASLPEFYRGAIVSTWADANENVADTTHLAIHLAELREKSGPGHSLTIRPRARQARLCSRPCRRMSLGRSMPMKTILLRRSSPSAHCGPKSLPMSWCTPWKITLRSVPFM
jgi:hypothetical protein